MLDAYTLPGWILLAWSCVTLLIVCGSVLLLIRQRHRNVLADLEHQSHVAELQLKLEYSDARVMSAESERLRLATELANAQEHNFELRAQYTAEKVRFTTKESHLHSEIESLKSAKESMIKEFENLANRLFDAKQEHFSRSTQTQLQQMITPFREQLKDFRSRVEEVQQQESARHHQLIGQIIELQKQSHKIGMDAVNLTNALKGSNKAMGSWGEMILANLLEQMGFQKKRDYDIQVSQTTADGKRLQPDVLVYLPDEKDLIIDAKVSLLAYEQYYSAESEPERAHALKAHLESLRGHIRNLGSKKYAEFVGRKRLDFVCLFVPIEAAFVCAVQEAPDLLQDAYDKHVLLASPASLFVILRTINALWQRDRQDKNVEQIVVSAGKLHDQFVRFLESMQEVGTGIERASRSFNTAMNRLESGNGNLIKRSDDLRRLGAKTSRSIPQELVDQAQSATENLENLNE